MKDNDEYSDRAVEWFWLQLFTSLNSYKSYLIIAKNCYFDTTLHTYTQVSFLFKG